MKLQSADALQINLAFKILTRYLQFTDCNSLVFLINIVHELSEYFMSLDTNRYFKNFMVMSGMNIDLLKIDKQKGDNYKILMGSYGLEYLINETTRKTNTTESCIDHVYTRVQNKNRLSIAATFIRRQVTYHYLTAVRLICRVCGGAVIWMASKL